MIFDSGGGEGMRVTKFVFAPLVRYSHSARAAASVPMEVVCFVHRHPDRDAARRQGISSMVCVLADGPARSRTRQRRNWVARTDVLRTDTLIFDRWKPPVALGSGGSGDARAMTWRSATARW